MMPIEGEGYGWNAPVEPVAPADSPEPQAFHLGEPVEQSAGEGLFPLAQHVEGGSDSLGTRGPAGCALDVASRNGGRAQIRQILDGAEASRHAFVRQGARLESIGQALAGRPDLVGEEIAHHVFPTPQDGLVRAEPFVGRRHHEIGAEGGHVDAGVRSELNGVDVGQRSRRTGLAGKRADVIDRAGQVRGVADGKEAGARAEDVVEGPIREFIGFRIEFQPSDLQALLFRKQEPRGHIGVVIHAGQDDLVAGGQPPPDTARHVEGQRRHVLPEHDLARRGGVVEVRSRLMGLVDQRSGCHGRPKTAAEIGVRREEGLGHALDHPARHLGTRGVVEIDAGAAFVGRLKGGEFGPDPVDGKVVGHAAYPLGMVTSRPRSDCLSTETDVNDSPGSELCRCASRR